MNDFRGIGRLTKDVTVNYTPSQLAVARFNIALDRGKDKNGESRGQISLPAWHSAEQLKTLNASVGKGCVWRSLATFRQEAMTRTARNTTQQTSCVTASNSLTGRVRRMLHQLRIMPLHLKALMQLMKIFHFRR